MPTTIEPVFGHQDELRFVTDRGLVLRAVRSERIGTHSTIYRVFAPFDAAQKIAGEFHTFDPQHGEPDITPFKWHPWVFDDYTRLIPWVKIKLTDGRVVQTGAFTRLEVVMQDNCSMRVAFRAPFSGFVFEGFVTFYHNSPVADFRGVIVWSDRQNSASDLFVDTVSIGSGEPIKLDFAVQHGHSFWPSAETNEWVTTLGRNVGFVDGSGIPLMGRMLCLPTVTHGVATATDYDPATYSDTDPAANSAQDMETITAAAHGPVLGCVDSGIWNGVFLSNRNVARTSLSYAQLMAQADAILRPFFAQPVAGSFYSNRPIGCSKDPSGTGDQEDFNATKGWCVTLAADPRWLHYALHSVAVDVVRGPLLYETDGSPLDPAAHPNWTTWSMYTHWHSGQSPDRLGKADIPWGGRSATTWKNYDEEHRSQNNLAAVYALTGDPLLLLLIERYSTADICSVRFRRNFGTGAPRAIGRQAHCWANFLTVLPVGSVTATRYQTLLDDILRQTLRDWHGDRFPGPVDVLYDRTDARMGITFNGQPVPAWSCWEHGLFVVGAYAAWKATKNPQWLSLVQRVSRTIVRYATFKDAQGWVMLATCHWPKTGNSPTGVAEGEPLPPNVYSRTSTLVNPNDGGTSTWTRNAILVFIETHAADDPDMARAQEIAAAFAPGEFADLRAAEWAACVRSVPAVPGAYVSY